MSTQTKGERAVSERDLLSTPVSRLRAAAVHVPDHRRLGGQAGPVALAVVAPLQRFSRLWGSLDLS